MHLTWRRFQACQSKYSFSTGIPAFVIPYFSQPLSITSEPSFYRTSLSPPPHNDNSLIKDFSSLWKPHTPFNSWPTTNRLSAKGAQWVGPAPPFPWFPGHSTVLETSPTPTTYVPFPLYFTHCVLWPCGRKNRHFFVYGIPKNI